MSHKKERFSTIEELNLSAMSRGISPGRLASEVGFSWKRHRVVLTGDGTFHFFWGGREVAPPDSLADISDISKEICYAITENVVIPSGVTSIGDDAFLNCSDLKSVTIPDSVTNIGWRAFMYCDGLKSLTIGNGVKSIGWYAFYCCIRLTDVTIPDGVTSIGEKAFSGCIRLTDVTIPDGVTSIGAYAFAYCDDLTSVSIPSRATSIGDGAFYGCSGLKSIIITRKFEYDLEKIGLDPRKTKVSFSD